MDRTRFRASKRSPTGAWRDPRAEADRAYLLGGYSFGGLIALEVAQQLTAGGERVGQLFLIDAVYGERYWPRSVWLEPLHGERDGTSRDLTNGADRRCP